MKTKIFLVLSLLMVLFVSDLLSADYKGFAIIDASTPPPWGAIEEQNWYDMIDWVGGSAIIDTSQTAGHKHNVLWDTSYDTSAYVDGNYFTINDSLVINSLIVDTAADTIITLSSNGTISKQNTIKMNGGKSAITKRNFHKVLIRTNIDTATYYGIQNNYKFYVNISGSVGDNLFNTMISFTPSAGAPGSIKLESTGYGIKNVQLLSNYGYVALYIDSAYISDTINAMTFGLYSEENYKITEIKDTLQPTYGHYNQVTNYQTDINNTLRVGSTTQYTEIDSESVSVTGGIDADSINFGTAGFVRCDSGSFPCTVTSIDADVYLYGDLDTVGTVYWQKLGQQVTMQLKGFSVSCSTAGDDGYAKLLGIPDSLVPSDTVAVPYPRLTGNCEVVMATRLTAYTGFLVWFYKNGETPSFYFMPGGFTYLLRQ